jgi:hypothetical protein
MGGRKEKKMDGRKAGRKMKEDEGRKVKDGR